MKKGQKTEEVEGPALLLISLQLVIIPIGIQFHSFEKEFL